MDADILRLILFLAGIAVILGIYLWDRHKKTSQRVHAIRREMQEQEQGRREPAWQETPMMEADGSPPAMDDAELDQALGQLDQLVQEERDERPVAPEGEQISFSFDDHTAPAAEGLPTMILQLNIRVRSGQASGDAIMDVAREIRMEPGEMQIFHRYEAGSDRRTPSFSMASLVEPGIFPFENMSDFSTPGVTLFTQLPGTKNGMEIFDDMLAAAERIAAMLDGEIQDESHSDLSHQTIEHIREEITEHSRQIRLARQRK